MKKIKSGFIIPSATCFIKRSQIKFRKNIEKPPEIGDLVYGVVLHKGKHHQLENQEGRIHTITEGTKSIFVFGNRYAPDMYEGLIPKIFKSEVDLLSRSGIVGEMISKNSNMPDCTKIKIYGYVCDENEKVLNTKNYAKITTKFKENKSKMILCIGSSMNSGKSLAAAKCCWALNVMNYPVNACKITGTSSLKDILLMEDSGAQNVADFTYLGFPSTYMLDEEDLLKIFTTLDNKYYVKNGYWIVEFADGIFQRETAMLLKSDIVKKRIHKTIYCAHDAAGIIGGTEMLKNNFGIIPDGLSGYFSSSPLAVKEVREFIDIPHFDSMKNDLNEISKIIFED